MNKTGFVISASLAMVATNAMAAVQEKVTVDDKFALDTETMKKIDTALGQRSVNEAISQMFNVLADHYGDGNGLLKDRFTKLVTAGVLDEAVLREVGGTIRLAVHSGSTDYDSTDVNAGNTAFSGCYTNCYSNCHGACHGACHGDCHGSRGWR
jgi:hypothetical protein